jgi:hypothetical protein
MLRNVMIYHAGEATFLEDEDYDTLVRITRLALPADTPAGDRFVNAYWTTRVVDAMRRTGHGGIVLLVPSGRSDWRDALSDGGLTELGWLKAEGKLVALLHAERYLL